MSPTPLNTLDPFIGRRSNRLKTTFLVLHTTTISHFVHPDHYLFDHLQTPSPKFTRQTWIVQSLTIIYKYIFTFRPQIYIFMSQASSPVGPLSKTEKVGHLPFSLYTGLL